MDNGDGARAQALNAAQQHAAAADRHLQGLLASRDRCREQHALIASAEEQARQAWAHLLKLRDDIPD
jgi:hypothetical protein